MDDIICPDCNDERCGYDRDCSNPTEQNSDAVPGYKPSGLHSTDTLDDALKRADSLARPGSYSGLLCSNKDLRRIVLLAYEYRKLKLGL